MGIEEVLFFQIERNLRCPFVTLPYDIVLRCYETIFVNKTHQVVVVIDNFFFHQEISIFVFFLCCKKFRSVDCWNIFNYGVLSNINLGVVEVA